MTNYIFPELAYYKPAWVPLLKAARKWVEDRRSTFVCNSLDYAARECGGDDDKHSKEVKGLIASAIGGCCTVIEWQPAPHITRMAEQRAYRLAWIDHIIAECEK